MLTFLLFNCVLDAVIARWKARIGNSGVAIQMNEERLSNSRYVDDILVYAKSLHEAIAMIELLMEEFQRVGLSLNALKAKILNSPFNDDGDD